MIGGTTGIKWGLVLAHKLRRAVEGGVWNGHSYEVAPAMVIPNNPKYGEGDEDTCDGVVDRCHVPIKSTGEEESDLEHHRQTFDEEAKWPFLEPDTLSLTVSTPLDHRPARVPHVSVEPLLR